ncbi:MAG: hypothetical protein IPK81_01620 [Rhodospirillales bacterium]|nr:MAG: hypothetical protein IPK81_01620 [Rhodospirillales bacterium]
MRRAAIDAEDRRMVERQREFRRAADVVTDAWMAFPEIDAVAVIGAVAKALWKEVPRFSEFRRARVEIWHECGDLDMAVWISSQRRLGELRRATDRALRAAYEAGKGVSVVGHQLDVFLFEPGTDRYLGRLCSFASCPKDKPPCRVPGCGAIAFNKRVPDFAPDPGLLAGVAESTLYRRGAGRLRSALELPDVGGGRDAPA